MNLSHTILILAFCTAFGVAFGSQTAQVPKSSAKSLTNEDVVDLLKAGLSTEIVVTKIKTSACAFDTSPDALKALKTATVPDVVILAMLQAPTRIPAQTGVSAGPNLLDELSAPGRVDCGASHRVEPIPVFSSPRTQQSSNQSPTESVEVFKVECGRKIIELGDEKQSWLKMRTEDGRIGYISSAMVFIQLSAEQKRAEIQRVADDFEDCRVRSQNEYDTKINVAGTLTLTPAQRVYASARLKQNLDAES